MSALLLRTAAPISACTVTRTAPPSEGRPPSSRPAAAFLTPPPPLSPPAAFLLFVLTYGSALYFGFFTDLLDLSWIYDNYAALLTAACIFR